MKIGSFFLMLIATSSLHGMHVVSALKAAGFFPRLKMQQRMYSQKPERVKVVFRPKRRILWKDSYGVEAKGKDYCAAITERKKWEHIQEMCFKRGYCLQGCAWHTECRSIVLQKRAVEREAGKAWWQVWKKEISVYELD